MTARAIFAAVAALFERPHFNDAPAIAPPVRIAERDGLVSEATAFRVRTAFERFARSLFGGGG